MERMRQRIEARRNQDNSGGRWFRVGVLSATALAPLIARWSDLRASNRTQALRDLAAARISSARDARDQAVIRLAPVRAVANARMSDARDVASARLSDARDLASAQFDSALDRLAQAPVPERLRTMPPFSLAIKRAEVLRRQRQRQRQRTTLLWLAGVGVGLVAAGGAAYFIARRRMASAIEDDEPMVELPRERNLAEAVVGRGTAMSDSYAANAATDGQAEVSVPLGTFTPASGTTNAAQAPYIGNIHTMVFHDADDTGHLPAEENRIYFSSEDEARQAGYRYSSEAEDAPRPENQA